MTLPEIKEILPSIDLLTTIEAGFAAYLAHQAVVPPVGELLGQVIAGVETVEKGPDLTQNSSNNVSTFVHLTISFH